MQLVSTSNGLTKVNMNGLPSVTIDRWRAIANHPTSQSLDVSGAKYGARINALSLVAFVACFCSLPAENHASTCPSLSKSHIPKRQWWQWFSLVVHPCPSLEKCEKNL